MNTELFIARKVFFNKKNRKSITSKIVSIAIASISIGLAVMIISVSVLIGFKKEVREKISGFSGHILVVNYDSNNSTETVNPITVSDDIYSSIRSINNVRSVFPYATKPGMIIVNNEMKAMVIKGVDQNYDWNFFQKHLINGKVPSLSPSEKNSEILISRSTSQALHLSIGDDVFCYFYKENSSLPQNKKFIVSGIYETKLEEFDDLFIIGDIKQIQHLNKWQSNEVSGIEVQIKNFNNIDFVSHVISNEVMQMANEDQFLKVTNIKRLYPQHFDWLHLLDMNVWVILTIMVVVSGFNMISGLLILILERTQMIGILKAIGSPDISIRKVFIYLSSFLIGKGLLWGNMIGIIICLGQYYFGIIQLNPETYYLDTVPILLRPIHLLLLNVSTLAVTVIMLILPTNFIAKISPDRAIQFE